MNAITPRKKNNGLSWFIIMLPIRIAILGVYQISAQTHLMWTSQCPCCGRLNKVQWHTVRGLGLSWVIINVKFISRPKPEDRSLSSCWYVFIHTEVALLICFPIRKSQCEDATRFKNWKNMCGKLSPRGSTRTSDSDSGNNERTTQEVWGCGIMWYLYVMYLSISRESHCVSKKIAVQWVSKFCAACTTWHVMKTGAFQLYKIGDWAGTSSCRRRLTETGKLSTWSGHEVSGLRTSAFHLYFSFIISGVFLKFLVFDFACCRLAKKFGSVFDLPSIVAPTLDSREVCVEPDPD